MATGQLWLFDPPKPLIERFGKDFFRTLPTGPGVYLFCGEAEGVLYVGSAVNLRKRLCSYRVANPERLPRRIIRLLHQVRRIEWDVCKTEHAARCREELLICVLGPKFNAAGKVWPRRMGSGTTYRTMNSSASSKLELPGVEVKSLQIFLDRILPRPGNGVLPPPVAAENKASSERSLASGE